MTAKEQVLNELTEMKKVGIRVPNKARVIAAQKAEELYQNGMKVSEIASLCIELS